MVSDDVIEEVVCLDTSVLIKSLTDEEPVEDSRAAQQIVRRCITSGRVVAPAFAWAEIGSVLRKKTRQSMLTLEQATVAWTQFGRLPIEYMNDAEVRDPSWNISAVLGLPTLYDASFLACCEVARSRLGQVVQLLTADTLLLNQVQGTVYTFVRDFRDAA
jgi:predicted nucleic acid-binding protein